DPTWKSVSDASCGTSCQTSGFQVAARISARRAVCPRCRHRQRASAERRVADELRARETGLWLATWNGISGQGWIGLCVAVSLHDEWNSGFRPLKNRTDLRKGTAIKTCLYRCCQ